MTTAKKKMRQESITGSTVGMFEVLLLFLPATDTEEDVWLSSKSPPLTLLEGDVALLLFKAMVKPWGRETTKSPLQRTWNHCALTKFSNLHAVAVPWCNWLTCLTTTGRQHKREQNYTRLHSRRFDLSLLFFFCYRLKLLFFSILVVRGFKF